MDEIRVDGKKNLMTIWFSWMWGPFMFPSFIKSQSLFRSIYNWNHGWSLGSAPNKATTEAYVWSVFGCEINLLRAYKVGLHGPFMCEVWVVLVGIEATTEISLLQAYKIGLHGPFRCEIWVVLVGIEATTKAYGREISWCFDLGWTKMVLITQYVLFIY